jgi:hypothetical protein
VSLRPTDANLLEVLAMGTELEMGKDLDSAERQPFERWQEQPGRKQKQEAGAGARRTKKLSDTKQCRLLHCEAFLVKLHLWASL